MQKRKILHLFLGFSIMLQAAFFQVAMPNLVLCIGEDGHVAFEWHSQNTSDHHKDSALPNLFIHSKTADSASDKANCKDINLHFHPSQAEKTQNKNIVKISAKLFFAFYFKNQERTNPPVSIKLFQPTLVNLNIGTEQSPVLII